MEMTFNNVLRLILIFFNLAEKYADTVSEEAANLGNIYIEDGTLYLATGYVGDKIFDADVTDGTLAVGITERELSADLSDSTLAFNFT